MKPHQKNIWLVDNAQVLGFSESLKASKYPMATDTGSCTPDVTERVQKLAGCAPGTGHDQFLTGIIVQFDLTYTVKAWTEAERYHFLNFVSSQSTMHRIAQFDLDNRGPGDFFGSRQHGLPALRTADLLRDARMLEYARSEAHALIAADPALEGYPALQAAVAKLFADEGSLN